MNYSYQLLPSIMCINWLNAESDLEKISPFVNYFHWDLVDGYFAPDFTMGSSIINTFRDRFSNKGDYHLMIEEPSRLFNSFNFKEGDRVCIHAECSKNLLRDLQRLKESGVSPGVALSPATPLSVLDYILDEIDRVLILTVNPGYHSQPLVKRSIGKIKNLEILLSESGHTNIDIVADGNVNLSTIPKMYKSGAREFVLGRSGLFEGDISQNFKEIVSLINTLEKNK